MADFSTTHFPNELDNLLSRYVYRGGTLDQVAAAKRLAFDAYISLTNTFLGDRKPYMTQEAAEVRAISLISGSIYQLFPDEHGTDDHIYWPSFAQVQGVIEETVHSGREWARGLVPSGEGHRARLTDTLARITKGYNQELVDAGVAQAERLAKMYEDELGFTPASAMSYAVTRLCARLEEIGEKGVRSFLKTAHLDQAHSTASPLRYIVGDDRVSSHDIANLVHDPERHAPAVMITAWQSTAPALNVEKALVSRAEGILKGAFPSLDNTQRADAAIRLTEYVIGDNPHTPEQAASLANYLYHQGYKWMPDWSRKGFDPSLITARHFEATHTRVIEPYETDGFMRQRWAKREDAILAEQRPDIDQVLQPSPSVMAGDEIVVAGQSLAAAASMAAEPY